MMSKRYTRYRALAWLALGSVTAIFACDSSDVATVPSTNRDAGEDVRPVDGSVADVDASADADAGDDEEVIVPDASVVCGQAPCAVAITGSGSSFCALLQDGRVSCWGSNEQGQLGYEVADSTFSATPRVANDLAHATSVSLGERNGCARVESGEVFCWGAPALVYAGITSDGGEVPFEPVTHPTHQDAVPAAKSIVVGSGLACVITSSDGSLSCWGENGHLELGRGSTASAVAPPGKAALPIAQVAAVVPGVQRTFAIGPSGEVASWGASTQFGTAPWGTGNQFSGHRFLLGRDSSEDPDGVPALVALVSRVRSLATGRAHACVVSGRDVDCWGANDFGQIGRGTFDTLDYLPSRSNLHAVVGAEETDSGLPNVDVPLTVAVGEGHSCVVMGSGRVYCWGSNRDTGLLGTNKIERTGTPTRIEGLSGPAVSLASGDSAACALLRTGAVECWGQNDSGQLGSGTSDPRPHPTPVRVLLPN